MEIHVYGDVHLHFETNGDQLDTIQRTVNEIRRQGRTITMKANEALELLQAADADTSEIAEGIRQLLEERDDIDPELAAALTAHADRLEGVAAGVREDPVIEPEPAPEGGETGGGTEGGGEDTGAVPTV